MAIFQNLISVVLICGGLVYLSACLFAFSGHFRLRQRDDDFKPFVSVIIAARNEEENIGFLLDDLLVQDYPAEKLEIIVADDCSDDNTRGVVKEYIAKDIRIKLVETQFSKSPYSHKKKAVHEGILSSSGEIIMTTDADCRVTSRWVNNMVRFLTPNVDFVAGDVIVHGGGFLGMLEALEMAGIQSMASGFMNAGFPITCNGANLCYRRTAFERVNGYEGIGHMVSGDDDLLMQKIAHGNPSKVVYISGLKNAIFSDAVKKTSDFFARRARWASKIAYYPSKKANILLSVFFGFFVAILIALIFAVFGVFAFLPLIAALSMKIAGDMLLTVFGVIRMRRLKLMLVFPVAEILHIPYIIAVTLKGYFGSFVWRGRRVTAVSLECGENSGD